MPRKPRLHVTGGIYHVILRGNNRQAIFRASGDRADFEELLALALDRYVSRALAYCWMTNHVHLAIQVAEQPLSALMRFVAAQYARRFNRRYRRTGHLFERRYRALLVDGERYLISLVRYIHRNPIEAGLVRRAGDYQWSSHRDYLGLRRCSWLDTGLLLAIFGDHVTSARRQLDAFVHTADDGCDIDVLLRGNQSDERVVTDDGEFLNVLDQRTSCPADISLEEIILRNCAAHGVSEASLTGADRSRRFAMIRSRIATEALERGAATLAELARRFNRAESVIYRSIQRYSVDKKRA